MHYDSIIPSNEWMNEWMKWQMKKTIKWATWHRVKPFHRPECSFLSLFESLISSYFLKIEMSLFVVRISNWSNVIWKEVLFVYTWYADSVCKQLIQDKFIHNVNPCWTYKFQHRHENDVLIHMLCCSILWLHSYFNSFKLHTLLSISLLKNPPTQKPSKLFFLYKYPNIFY